MKHRKLRLCACALALTLTLILAAPAGRAALSDVYFTAVNEQLLDMSSDTMPFWSGGVLYVSSRIFEGTDLGVNYVRNNTMGLAMLYTNQVDLRFDLEEQLAYDKRGNVYSGHAIERGGVVFFPLDLVCRYFGLTWSFSQTDTVPLIRVKSSSGILDDVRFIDAASASGQMASRYADYVKSVGGGSDGGSKPAVQPKPPGQQQEETPPAVQAVEGQKVYLIIDTVSREDTLAALQILGSVQATFLLGLDDMADGDLLRGLVAGGHGIALRMEDGTEEELRAARELLWQSCCSWLDMVWYEGREDIGGLLASSGCVQVRATLDRRNAGLRGAEQANNLLRSVGQYRTDLAVYLGSDAGCLGGLRTLLDELAEARYCVCAWRLTA